MSNEVVGNGFQPFRRVDEAVGRGPRTRRFSDCSGNSPNNGKQSLHRKHVMAVVGNGFQPFRSGKKGTVLFIVYRVCKERFPTVPDGVMVRQVHHDNVGRPSGPPKPRCQLLMAHLKVRPTKIKNKEALSLLLKEKIFDNVP